MSGFQDLRNKNICILFLSVVFMVRCCKYFLTLYYFPLCQLPWWQKVSSLVWVLEPTYWGNWEGKGALWLAAPLDPQCSKVKKKTGSYQKDGVLDTGWAKAIYVSLTKIRCALLLSVSFSLSFCFSLLMLKLKH